MAVPKVPGVTLDDARQLVETAIAAGAGRGFAPLAVAVVDLTGEVVALQRSDGARPLTSRVAVAKARSALVALMPSGALDQLPEAITAALRVTYGGDFVARAGGVPAVRDGVVLGAVGAAGAASDEDEAAVREALQQWGADPPS
jgi:uncharacterized protein GlcG (DUF336 family)